MRTRRMAICLILRVCYGENDVPMSDYFYGLLKKKPAPVFYEYRHHRKASCMTQPVNPLFPLGPRKKGRKCVSYLPETIFLQKKSRFAWRESFLAVSLHRF